MIQFWLTTFAIFTACYVGQPAHARNACAPNTHLWKGKCVPDKAPPAPQADATPAPPRLNNPTVFTGLTKFVRGPSSRTNITAANVGTLYRTDGVVDGGTFADIEMTGSSYLFRAYSAGQAVRNTTFSRIRSLDAGSAFLKFRGDSSNVVIEDVTVVATRPTKEISALIGFAGKTTTDVGSNVTIRRVNVRGCKSTAAYQNCDGLATEGRYSAFTITDSYFGFNSEAGVDLKSKATRLDRVTSEMNRRNFKLWADGDHGVLTSIEPGQPGNGAAAHIQLMGDKGLMHRVHIAKLTARSSNTTPLFQMEHGPWEITVDACDLALPAGTKLIAGAAALVKASKITLGASCRGPA